MAVGDRQPAVGFRKTRLPAAEAQLSPLIFAGLVAFGEAIRPDPIPNSAVKRFSANGTLSQDTGE